MVFDFTVSLTRHDSIIFLAHGIVESLFVTQCLKMSDTKQDR